MGRVCVLNFVSIDGVIQSPLSAGEDPDGGFAHGGWVADRGDDTVNRFMRDATVGASGLLLGRRSYEILAAAWSAADPAEPAIAAMNAMPKYVVTRTLDTFDWDSTHRAGDDLRTAVAEITARHDGDVVVLGSGELVAALAARDLVDEYRLLVFPVVLGAGKRMFDDGGSFRAFTLADSVTSPGGVVILTWRR